MNCCLLETVKNENVSEESACCAGFEGSPCGQIESTKRPPRRLWDARTESPLDLTTAAPVRMSSYKSAPPQPRVFDVRGMSSWGKYDVKYSLTLSYSTHPIIPSNPSSIQYHIMSAWTFLWNPFHVPQHKESMHIGVFCSAMVKHNMLVVMLISILNVFFNRKTSSNLLWTHFVYKSDSVSSNDWTAFWSFKSVSQQIEVYETWLVLNNFFKYIHFYDPCYFLSSVDFVVKLMTEFLSHSEFGWDISF